MNINRHNYETFFLLYVDNELPAAERKAVEEFVRENTDLAVELQLLLETTLPGETISYNAAEGLHKNEVELDALQQNLLLHLDNELDAFSKSNIEAKILSDNAIKKEWQLWEQTKLDATGQIVFKDKKLLYRHEGSRVISMRFRRVAAAAAILLIGLFTGISILRKEKSVDNSTAKTEIKTQGKKPADNKNKISSTNNSSVPLEKTTTENTASTQSAQEKDKKDINSTTIVNRNEKPVDRNNIASEQSIKNNKLGFEKPSLENINKQKSNETNTSTVSNNKRDEIVSPEKTPDEIAKTTIKEKIAAPANPVVDYNSIPAMPDSYAKTAGLNEGSPENNNNISYMSQETVNRSKVGGIFRRVKRIIERNTNIKTGNGVKIAGFEIALK